MERFAVERFADELFADERFAVERFADELFAVERFADERFADERFADERFAVERFAVERFAEDRFAVDRFAEERFAEERFAPERFAEDAFADERLAPERLDEERFAEDRFAVERFADERLAEERLALGRSDVDCGVALSDDSSLSSPPASCPPFSSSSSESPISFRAPAATADVATPSATPVASFFVSDGPSLSSSSPPCSISSSMSDTSRPPCVYSADIRHRVHVRRDAHQNNSASRSRLNSRAVSAFADLGTLGPQDIWNGVSVRAIHGERITFGVVELDAHAVVPEHSHENEQLGIVLSGSLTFRIGDESRELAAGATYCIPANVPHEVIATGPDGAVVIDVFAPTRADWSKFEPQAPRETRWP